MDAQNRPYDVAISFVWEHVDLAAELYELLRDRMSVFFAKEDAARRVGTDGEDSFSRAFRDDSRVVVVFYTALWGKTPFTRAEHNAIKQRCFYETYESTIWVPLDKGSAVPAFVPPQRLWHDLEHYGMSGLAAAVEERVRASGVEVREATAEDQLLRMKRRREMKARSEAFARSREGRAFFDLEVGRILGLLKENEVRIREVDQDLHFLVREDGNRGDVYAQTYGFRLLFQGSPLYAGTAHGALIKQHFMRLKRRDNAIDPEVETTVDFSVALDEAGTPGWSTRGGRPRSLDDVVREAVDTLALREAAEIEKR